MWHISSRVAGTRGFTWLYGACYSLEKALSGFVQAGGRNGWLELQRACCGSWDFPIGVLEWLSTSFVRIAWGSLFYNG